MTRDTHTHTHAQATRGRAENEGEKATLPHAHEDINPIEVEVAGGHTQVNHRKSPAYVINDAQGKSQRNHPNDV